MSTPIDSARPITRLNKYAYPIRMIFFDTESNIKINDVDEYHSLRLGVAIFAQCSYNNGVMTIVKREVYYYHTGLEFWRYVETKTEKNNILYLYAHNAKYDSLNVDIVTGLKGQGYDIPFPTISHAFIISAKKGKKKIKVVDTFNYVRTSVKAMGEKLGIEKIDLSEYKDKKGNIDFNTIPEYALYKYCENDVAIIEKFMLELIKFLYTNKLGSLKFTTASIALDIYRHTFISTPIYYHKNDTILAIERNAYRGGIVECFHLRRLPKDKYYLLDINSMYVSVMATKKLPVYPILYNDAPELNDLYHAVETNYIIADVLLCVERNNGAYALSHEDKLIFPKGEYRITLHQPELEQAIKEGIILKVFNYVVYHAEKCLSEYALYFSELKKNATNKTDYDFAKLLGNGLYGKFGMQKYKTDKFKFALFWQDDRSTFKDKSIERLSNKAKSQYQSDVEIQLDHNKGYVVTNKGVYLKWNGEFIRTYTDKLTHVPRTNIALAGAVTAYSRILLSSYINIAEDENVFYGDTDSLAVNQLGYDRLKEHTDEKELGKLKCEFIFNSGIIRAPKNYTFSVKKKLNINLSTVGLITTKKGNIKNILTLEQKSINLKRRDRSKGIPTGAVMENGKYIYWRFTTFIEYLKSNGQLKGRVKASRKNTLRYTKGNGQGRGRTQPFIMQHVFNKDKQKWQNQVIN